MPLVCQDRHCPNCGRSKAVAWVAEREKELMDVKYYHVVFTVPGELRSLFLENQRELYKLFFDSVHATLMTFALDAKWLGGVPSILAVLHTTNRQLGYHPHIHAVVSGCGWNASAGRLEYPKSGGDYLFPVRALANWFRGRMVSGVRRLWSSGQLRLESPKTGRYRSAEALGALLDVVHGKAWQVHLERTFGRPEHVVRYLAQYTHKTAISNRRVVSVGEGKVAFVASRSPAAPPVRVTTDEFVRRMARHVLPKRFHRIRRWGLLSATKRQTMLPRAQAAAGVLRVRARVAESLQLVAKPPPCRRCGGAPVELLDMASRRHVPLRLSENLPRPPPPWNTRELY